MNILSIDTAIELLAVGLRTENGSFYEYVRSDGFGHVRNLMPAIDALLREARIAIHDIGLIVCAKGPGSFTGLRIGMATAKGLALAAECSLLSVPTLDALTYRFAVFPDPVIPVIDARKGRVYTAVYRGADRTSDYLDLEPTELPALIGSSASRVLLTGTSAVLLESIRKVFERSGIEANVDPSPDTGRSSAYIDLGRRMFGASGPDPDDAGPLYVRMSDAESGRRR